MSAMEKSDLPEVARKRANKAVSAAAEPVERRGGPRRMRGCKARSGRRAGSRVTRAGPHTRSRHQEQKGQADGVSYLQKQEMPNGYSQFVQSSLPANLAISASSKF
jgi:hypothetical protein